MARVSKEFEVRKQEIMNIAQSLFYQKGYTNTSVNLIIETIGISKGTFYHYFKSKEDLLDSITQEFTDQILERINPIVNDNSLNAIEKLNQFYRLSGMYKADNFSLLQTLIKIFIDDANLILRDKIKLKSYLRTAPIFTQILTQGKKEGVFDISHPKETAQMILHLGSAVSDETGKLFVDVNSHPENIQKLILHFDIYQKSVERILGAPENSIKIMDGNFISKLQEWCNEN